MANGDLLTAERAKDEEPHTQYAGDVADDSPKLYGEGHTVGNYRIVRLLGKGGMGAVYEVEHVQLGMHYALKAFTLDHGMVDLLRERFLAEGRVLALLKHPNLVRVHDLDFDTATNMPYFVMDMIRSSNGEPYTLHELSPGDADEQCLVDWFDQLTSALAYIHANGIVHRDIKPNNILIDENGDIVLGDFGVSRFFGNAIREAMAVRNTMSMVTGKLPIMGTAGFIAPEVANGEEATPAADWYAVGMVFYRLLTGMWYEDNESARGLLDDFEYDWNAVLPALLSTDPSQRIPRAPRKKDGETSSPSRRRRMVWAFAAAAAIAAMVVGAFFLGFPSIATSEDSESDISAEIAFAIPDSVK